MSDNNPYFDYVKNIQANKQTSQGASPQGSQPSELSAHKTQPGSFSEPRYSMNKPKGPLGALKKPLVATGALLTIAVLGGIGIGSLFTGPENAEAPIVIAADNTAYKQLPETPGGMSIPNQDSTVFAVVKDGEMQGQEIIESLLETEAAAGDEVETTVSDVAEEAEEMIENSAVSAEKSTQDEIEEIVASAEIPTSNAETTETVASVETPAKTPKTPVEVKSITETHQKITPQELIESAKADPSTTSSQPPSQLHAAGSSPETIAFVRSVLDKKGADDAASVASIEPAAGGASVAGTAISPGDYFVQVVSVPSQSGAESEWVKIQKSFTQVSGMDYRIKQADLGERGTYYRVQVGPMSKESASNLCASIKAQKPGGCLVTR